MTLRTRRRRLPSSSATPDRALQFHLPVYEKPSGCGRLDTGHVSQGFQKLPSIRWQVSVCFLAIHHRLQNGLQPLPQRSANWAHGVWYYRWKRASRWSFGAAGQSEFGMVISEEAEEGVQRSSRIKIHWRSFDSGNRECSRENAVQYKDTSFSGTRPTKEGP